METRHTHQHYRMLPAALKYWEQFDRDARNKRPDRLIASSPSASPASPPPAPSPAPNGHDSPSKSDIPATSPRSGGSIWKVTALWISGVVAGMLLATGAVAQVKDLQMTQRLELIAAINAPDERMFNGMVATLGRDVIDGHDKSGLTPLMHAARKGNTWSINGLLYRMEGGRNTHLANPLLVSKDGTSRTARSMAIHADHKQMLLNAEISMGGKAGCDDASVRSAIGMSNQYVDRAMKAIKGCKLSHASTDYLHLAMGQPYPKYLLIQSLVDAGVNPTGSHLASAIEHQLRLAIINVLVNADTGIVDASHVQMVDRLHAAWLAIPAGRGKVRYADWGGMHNDAYHRAGLLMGVLTRAMEHRDEVKPKAPEPVASASVEGDAPVGASAHSAPEGEGLAIPPLPMAGGVGMDEGASATSTTDQCDLYDAMAQSVGGTQSAALREIIANKYSDDIGKPTCTSQPYAQPLLFETFAWGYSVDAFVRLLNADADPSVTYVYPTGCHKLEGTRVCDGDTFEKFARKQWTDATHKVRVAIANYNDRHTPPSHPEILVEDVRRYGDGKVLFEFRVKLASEPEADVEVTITDSIEGVGTTPSALMFTASDYDVWQSVRVALFDWSSDAIKDENNAFNLNGKMGVATGYKSIPFVTNLDYKSFNAPGTPAEPIGGSSERFVQWGSKAVFDTFPMTSDHIDEYARVPYADIPDFKDINVHCSNHPTRAFNISEDQDACFVAMCITEYVQKGKGGVDLAETYRIGYTIIPGAEAFTKAQIGQEMYERNSPGEIKGVRAGYKAIACEFMTYGNLTLTIKP